MSVASGMGLASEIPLALSHYRVSKKPASSCGRYVGELLLILCMMLQASKNSVFKLAVPASLDPSTLNLGSLNLGFLMLLPYCIEELAPSKLSQFPASTWLWLTLSGLLYCVAGPTLLLMGLQHTSVTVAAIVDRTSTLNFLILARIFIGGDGYTNWTLFNCLLVILGVSAAFVLPCVGVGHDCEYPWDSVGVLYVWLQAWADAGSLCILKSKLQHVPSKLLVVARVGIGAILQNGVAFLPDMSCMFGTKAAADPQCDDFRVPDLYNRFSWGSWSTLVWWAPLYVCINQILWVKAVQLAHPITIALGCNSLFLLVIAWGVLLVHEIPDIALLISAAILAVSLLSSSLEVINQASQLEDDDEAVHFSGVSTSEQEDCHLHISETQSSCQTAASQASYPCSCCGKLDATAPDSYCGFCKDGTRLHLNW